MSLGVMYPGGLHIEGIALNEGNLPAILAAGACGMSMASNCNSRPPAAEVMVDDDAVHLIRSGDAISRPCAREYTLP